MEMTREHVEMLTKMLVVDLQPIGSVTYEARLTGFALLEEDVMFGFVSTDGTVYLRASAATAARFHALGAAKHPQMPYWTIPPAASAHRELLCELAYEAADMAHIACLFGVEDEPTEPIVICEKTPADAAVSLALLVA